jgi:hypothetical protein
VWLGSWRCGGGSSIRCEPVRNRSGATVRRRRRNRLRSRRPGTRSPPRPVAAALQARTRWIGHRLQEWVLAQHRRASSYRGLRSWRHCVVSPGAERTGRARSRPATANSTTMASRARRDAGRKLRTTVFKVTRPFAVVYEARSSDG